MVIDDEAAVRDISRQTLEEFGYRFVTGSGGVEAISIYDAHRQHEIDLLVTDMMMPEMDGSTTIRLLLEMNPRALIVAASGLNASSMVAKAHNAGVEHFISKPYTAETLRKTLRDALAGRPMR